MNYSMIWMMVGVFLVVWIGGCVREGLKNSCVIDFVMYRVSFKKMYFNLGMSFQHIHDTETKRCIDVISLGLFFAGMEVMFFKYTEEELEELANGG